MIKRANTSEYLINGIHFPLNATTIIGKAWQLYLYNFKEYKYYLILPVICFVIYENTSFYFDLTNYEGSMEACVLWFALVFLVIFMYAYYMILYTKAFYNSLTGKNYSYEYVKKEFKGHKAKVSLLVVSTVLHMVFFPFILVVLFGLFLSFFSIMFSFNNIIIIVLSLIIVALIILYFIRGLIEAFLFIPAQVVVVFIDNTIVKESVKASRKLIKDCKPKSIYLGVCLLALIISLLILPYLVSIYSHIIINFVANMMIAKVSVGILLLILGIVNLVIIGPLVCGSMVLLYLDNRSHNEGIDLEFALETESIKLVNIENQ